MSNSTFEGKYELDSLAAFLKLSRLVHSSGSTHLFQGPSGPSSKSLWLRAVSAAVDTMVDQQQSTDEDEGERRVNYEFQRTTEAATDTLMQGGKGAPCARTGMSKVCMLMAMGCGGRGVGL
jgi:meiotically up-regulated gene 157 (Mug157) protein